MVAVRDQELLKQFRKKQMYLDKIHRPRHLPDVITKAISNSTRTIKAVQLRKDFPFEVTGITYGNCNISMNNISK